VAARETLDSADVWVGLLVGGDASYHTPSFQLVQLPSTAPVWGVERGGAVGVGVYGTLLGPERTITSLWWFWM
jgi:hypothetical protein